MPYNISRHLKFHATAFPDKKAVVLWNGASISFKQLDAECDRFAAFFSTCGIRKGMRVLVGARPGFSFVPTLFALFRMGAVPICMDPGLPVRRILGCVKDVGPDAIVARSDFLWISRLFPRVLPSSTLRVPIPKIKRGVIPNVKFESEPTAEDQMAAILFTSGSTGVAKGVIYSHGAFDSQRRILKEAYQIQIDEVDLVVFPLFALFSAAWGITAVIPKMNPARPARAKGSHLAYLIKKFQVTHTAGSPAIWKNLIEFCEKRELLFSSLKRILMAGAQVPEKIVRGARRLGCEVSTPYGATEALPLTIISDQQLEHTYPKTKNGAGTCVGKPLYGVDVAVIRVTDEPIDEWSDTLCLSPFERGEIVVKAPWVTRSYFGKEEANKRAKIPSATGLWHRMGDIGYLDDLGNLWFCGRKDHRIETPEGVVFPDPLEAIVDSVPGVKRSAVVAVGVRGQQRPFLVVEKEKGAKLIRSILEDVLKRTSVLLPIQGILFKKKFPLDIRHNIKMDRLALGHWAESRAR